MAGQDPKKIVNEPNDVPAGIEQGKPSSVQEMTLENVFETLRKATAKGTEKAANVNFEPVPVVIAGLEIPDPKETLKNLGDALILIPAFMRPDLKDLYFQSLPGNEVGKSTKEKTIVDPIMMLHPAYRFAHVIGHEAAHKKLKVPHEGLVEAYLRAIGVVDTGKNGETKTTEKYDKALAGFSEFLKRISKGRDEKAMALEVYNLYYKGDYEKIYKMYREIYVNKLPTGKVDEALKFFWDVFPELEYDTKGETQAQSVYKFRKPNFAPNPEFDRMIKDRK